LTVAAASDAPSALAANTGGAAAAAEQTAAAAPTAAKPKVKTFPVTSRSRSVAYKGPVYVRTTSGEVIPYVAGISTGSAASVTASGGAAPADAAPATPEAAPETPATPVTPIAGELVNGSGMTAATGPTLRPELLVPGSTARFVEGLAAAPMNAPAAVQDVIWAGNELIGLPYIYGGGHASFVSRGYDCSGTVSYALHGGSLIKSPEDSSEMETWGSHGAGRWIAVFSNPGHAYMTVAGLRLDTSAADDPSDLQGPRWRPLRTNNGGYRVRHPLGL
jgi:cell wall-associated NlpC family hydrolase